MAAHRVPWVNVRMACTCHEVVRDQQIAESQARALLRRADAQRCMLHEHVELPSSELQARAEKLGLALSEGRHEGVASTVRPVHDPVHELATAHLAPPARYDLEMPGFRALQRPDVSTALIPCEDQPIGDWCWLNLTHLFIAVGALLCLLSIVTMIPHFILPALVLLIAAPVVS